MAAVRSFSGGDMPLLTCYLDESGDTGSLPTSTSPIQPLICLMGLTLDATYLRPFTAEFLELKTRFFPGRFGAKYKHTHLSKLLEEIKGSDLRAAFRTDDHDRKHHHIGFFDALLDFVASYDCRIFGRVWIKGIGAALKGTAVYTYSAQKICETFNHLLEEANAQGIVIADSRFPKKNREVSFSVLTLKLSLAGDACPRIIEAPTFGHSENHAGLQICDLLCSGLLFPIAAYTYCTGYVANIHVHDGYAVLKQRYASKLRERQHRYWDAQEEKFVGGLVVNDGIAKRSGAVLFRN